MNKRNVIVSAAMTIVLCVCLIAGSTYAIFTSNDTVNIAATAGHLEISAALDVASLKTSTELSNYTATATNGVAFFENGGTAEVDSTGDNLTLTYMTPGDIVDCNINVTNDSNVAVKYRVKFVMEGELGAALTAKVVGDSASTSTSTVSASLNASTGKYECVTEWLEIETIGADKVINVQIAFPNGDDNGSVDNAFMDKACSVLMTVEAVQGNAR